MGKARKKVEKWMHKLKKGTLRRYLADRFGDKAFTAQHTIKVSYLRALANKAGKIGKDVSEKTRKRAQAALNMRAVRLRKKRR